MRRRVVVRTVDEDGAWTWRALSPEALRMIRFALLCHAQAAAAAASRFAEGDEARNQLESEAEAAASLAEDFNNEEG